MKKRKDIKGRNLRVGEFQRDDGRYQYSKMINGVRTTLYSNDLKELRRKEIEFLHKVNTESFVVTEKQYTLNEYAKFWFDNYAYIGRKARTVNVYRYYYNKYILEALGGVLLNKLNRNMIELLLNNYASNGFQKGTLGIIYNIIKAITTTAFDNNFISNNVCKYVKIPDVYEKSKTNIDKKQIIHFLQFLSNDNYYSKYLVLFLLLFSTGMRIGEACALTWDDINFRDKTITIRKTLFNMLIEDKNEYCISTPKSNKSNRCIPIDQKICELLLEEKNKTGNSSFEIYYFDSFGGKYKTKMNFIFMTNRRKPMSESTFRCIINGIVKKHNKQKGYKLDYFSPHQIRHTFTSLAYEAGIDVKMTSEILGHSNTQITLNRYTHLTVNKKKQEIKKINNLCKAIAYTTKITTNKNI